MIACYNAGEMHLCANMQNLDEDKKLIALVHSYLHKIFGYSEIAKVCDDDDVYFVSIDAPSGLSIEKMRFDYMESRDLAISDMKDLNGGITHIYMRSYH